MPDKAVHPVALQWHGEDAVGIRAEHIIVGAAFLLVIVTLALVLGLGILICHCYRLVASGGCSHSRLLRISNA